MKTLKEFVEELPQHIVKPLGAMTASKIIELENISNSLNVLLGVELEIYVKPAEIKEGRFYGVGIKDLLK